MLDTNVKTALLAFALGCLIAGSSVYLALHPHTVDLAEKIAELQRIVTTNESLLGYTKYKDYIAGGKRAIGEQAKLLTASVTRTYTVNRHVERSLFKVKSNGAVVVTYAVDYSFGYDLGPDSYDVVDTPAGLEIRIDRPALVSIPAVHDLHYEVMEKGWLTDEKAAALGLYEGASSVAAAEGRKMASDAEIMALCEKKLIGLLRDFLAKQPGVEHVPAITVSYAPRSAKGSRVQ